jgi:hypothetical protein
MFMGGSEEGLIKTFRAANKLTNTKDIAKRYSVRGIQVGDDFELLRFMPLSQLDAVGDSFRWGSSFLPAPRAHSAARPRWRKALLARELVIPSLILMDVTSSMTLLSRYCRVATAYGYSSKKRKLAAPRGGHGAANGSKRRGLSRTQNGGRHFNRESGQFMARRQASF